MLLITNSLVYLTASVKLQLNIFGDMGESNDSINGILLENIDKEMPINFQPSSHTCKRDSLY